MVPLKIYSKAYIRLRNFNPPTFCLVFTVSTGAGKHELSTRGACYVCNTIGANCKETKKHENRR